MIGTHSEQLDIVGRNDHTMRSAQAEGITRQLSLELLNVDLENVLVFWFEYAAINISSTHLTTNEHFQPKLHHHLCVEDNAKTRLHCVDGNDVLVNTFPSVLLSSDGKSISKNNGTSGSLSGFPIALAVVIFQTGRFVVLVLFLQKSVLNLVLESMQQLLPDYL